MFSPVFLKFLCNIRGYERGDLTFTAGESPIEVVDNMGEIWHMTEEELIANDGRTLDRVAGHLAF